MLDSREAVGRWSRGLVERARSVGEGEAKGRGEREEEEEEEEGEKKVGAGEAERSGRTDSLSALVELYWHRLPGLMDGIGEAPVGVK